MNFHEPSEDGLLKCDFCNKNHRTELCEEFRQFYKSFKPKGVYPVLSYPTYPSTPQKNVKTCNKRIPFAQKKENLLSDFDKDFNQQEILEMLRSMVREYNKNKGKETEAEKRAKLCTFGTNWKYCARCNPKFSNGNRPDDNRKCTKKDLELGIQLTIDEITAPLDDIQDDRKKFMPYGEFSDSDFQSVLNSLEHPIAVNIRKRKGEELARMPMTPNKQLKIVVKRTLVMKPVVSKSKYDSTSNVSEMSSKNLPYSTDKKSQPMNTTESFVLHKNNVLTSSRKQESKKPPVLYLKLASPSNTSKTINKASDYMDIKKTQTESKLNIVANNDSKSANSHFSLTEMNTKESFALHKDNVLSSSRKQESKKPPVLYLKLASPSNASKTINKASDFMDVKNTQSENKLNVVANSDSKSANLHFSSTEKVNTSSKTSIPSSKNFQIITSVPFDHKKNLNVENKSSVNIKRETVATPSPIRKAASRTPIINQKTIFEAARRAGINIVGHEIKATTPSFKKPAEAPNRTPVINQKKFFEAARRAGIRIVGEMKATPPSFKKPAEAPSRTPVINQKKFFEAARRAGIRIVGDMKATTPSFKKPAEAPSGTHFIYQKMDATNKITQKTDSEKIAISLLFKKHTEAPNRTPVINQKKFFEAARRAGIRIVGEMKATPPSFKKPAEAPCRTSFNYQKINPDAAKINPLKIESEKIATSPLSEKHTEAPCRTAFIYLNINQDTAKIIPIKIENKKIATSFLSDKHTEAPCRTSFIYQKKNLDAAKIIPLKIESEKIVTSFLSDKHTEAPCRTSFIYQKKNPDAAKIIPLKIESEKIATSFLSDKHTEAPCRTSFIYQKINPDAAKIIPLKIESEKIATSFLSNKHTQAPCRTSFSYQKINPDAAKIIPLKIESEKIATSFLSDKHTEAPNRTPFSNQKLILESTSKLEIKTESEKIATPLSSKKHSEALSRTPFNNQKLILEPTSKLEIKIENEEIAAPLSSKKHAEVLTKLTLDLKKINLDDQNEISVKFENKNTAVLSSPKKLPKAPSNKPFDNQMVNLEAIKKVTVKIENETIATSPEKLIEVKKLPQKLNYPNVKKELECLAEGKDLNDTVIEFYLKYIYNEKLTPEIQKKTYICSTFFYENLMVDTETKDASWYKLVAWLKDVDLFLKDFIIIPVNIKFPTKHWYLIIICYLSKVSVVDNFGNEICSNGSQNELQQKSDSQLTSERPCICFFDSCCIDEKLSKEKVAVAKKLRNFLKFLWLQNSKNRNESRKWSQLEFFHAVCPQQENSHDCGIFLLQFVESFFEKPITKFEDQLSVKNWFDQNKIANNRKKIKSIIEQNMAKK